MPGGNTMKTTIAALILALVCTMAGTAQAGLVTFSETLLGSTNDGVMQKISKDTPGTFQFNLNQLGYSAADYTITGASLTFNFFDRDLKSDAIKITSGANDGSLTLLNQIFLLNPLNKRKEITYTFGAENLSYLNDGFLTLLATSTNSISIDQLRLDVTAAANPVPLPSAVWFLGTSLVGMVAIRRRMTI